MFQKIIKKANSDKNRFTFFCQDEANKIWEIELKKVDTCLKIKLLQFLGKNIYTLMWNTSSAGYWATKTILSLWRKNPLLFPDQNH